MTLTGDTDIQTSAKKQAMLLQHFRTRWRQEYLTGLREFHQASDCNVQTVKRGAVVLVYNDTPRINWCLAIVEDTISREDGLQHQNIHRQDKLSNKKLYLLEITAAGPLPRQNSSPKTTSSDSDVQSSTVQQDDSTTTQERIPVRQAALRGRQLVQEWTKTLCGPPEDVSN